MWKVKDLEIRYLLTWKLFYPMFVQIIKLAAEKYPKSHVCCTKFIIGQWDTKLSMDECVFCYFWGNFNSVRFRIWAPSILLFYVLNFFSSISMQTQKFSLVFFSQKFDKTPDKEHLPSILTQGISPLMRFCEKARETFSTLTFTGPYLMGEIKTNKTCFCSWK